MRPGLRRAAARLAPAVLAALAAFSACSPASRPQGPAHTLRIAVGEGDVTTLNIHLNPHATVAYVAELTAAYFVRYDAHQKPIPELITEIPTQANGGIAADGKTIVWHLRRGVRWSDGAPFDARDVTFSVRTILNPANNEEQGHAGWDRIARIETPDPYTVVFRMKRPYADFLPVFFGTQGDNPCVLPQHLLGSLPNINTAAYNAKPVGIGPFRVVEWRRGDAIELEANPYYFRGRPKLDRVTIELLANRDTAATQMQSGEVDIWPLMPPNYVDRMKAVATLHVDVRGGFRTTNLDFEMSGRPLVADVRVREAIALAIDRARIVSAALHGYGSLHDGVVLPLDPPAPGSIAFRYDPQRARALLDAAGWHPGPDGIRVRNGVRLSLSVPFQSGASELAQQVELIRADLRGVGIALETRTYQPSLFHALLQEGGIVDGGHYDFTLYAQTLTDIEDVYGLYGCPNIVPNGENSSRYCSAAADALFGKLEETYAPAERRRLFEQLQGQIIRDLPTLVLYVWSDSTAWNERVTGYHPSPLTPFDDMMDVDAQ